MIHYRNYATLPSGKKVFLNEVKNDQYFILLKYIEGKDYAGFYSSLNTLIKATVPDFDDLHIIDKAYLYIAFCFYSVHNTIMIGRTVLGDTEYNLTILLTAIETSYQLLPSSIKFELIPGKIVETGLPCQLDIDTDTIGINYISGINTIADQEFASPEDKQRFITELPAKISTEIEKYVKKEFSIQCNLFGDYEINLIDPGLFYLIFQLFSEDLGNYYELQYYCFEYLKWSWDTFKQFTPLETRILFNLYKQDKEKQAEEQRKQALYRS